ncbi:CPBP family intramembrane metalloprotease, partial [Escherichia coli]|nr:CPBP family intramembrane metalloprotease [Escherichia coli]
MFSRLSQIDKSHILAFAISWLGWIPTVMGSHAIAPFVNPYFQFLLILSAVGPALAAVIVTRVAYGKAQVKTLLEALIQWRASLGWYLVAVLGPIGFLLVAQGITKFFTLSTTQP